MICLNQKTFNQLLNITINNCNKNIEYFREKNYSEYSKIAICFLTVRPSELFYNFCKKLGIHNYDIYICIDDNNYEIPNYDHKIPIIKINNKLCENAGFKSSVLYFKNKACSRDKSLYYFCKKNKKYDNIWFIEEDVFIPSVDTIRNIDNKYKDSDLLCKSRELKKDTLNWPHWERVISESKKDLPFERSLICAIRVSRKMLYVIEKYVETYKTLFMDEALFNTLANYEKLSVIAIPELSTIYFKKDWKLSNININNLYHPIKNINKQNDFRQKLGQV